MLKTYPLNLFEDLPAIRQKIAEYLDIVAYHISVYFEEKRTLSLQESEDEELQEYQDFFQYLSILNTYGYRQEWQDLLDELSEEYHNLTSELTLSTAFHEHSLTVLEDDALTQDERLDIQKSYDDFMKHTGKLTKKQKKQLIRIEKEEYKAVTNYSKISMDFQKNALCKIPKEDLNDLDSELLSHLSSDEHFYLLYDDAWTHHVLTQSNNEGVRQKIYAFKQQLGTLSPWNLEASINSLIPLRHELAQLYGYKSYSDMTLEELMVQNGDRALATVQSVGEAILPVMKTHAEALRMFALQKGIAFEPYNLAYLEDQYDQKHSILHAEHLRSFFNLERTIQHLHHWIEQHYDVTFESIVTDTWHPDVRVFQLTKNNEPFAYLYLDLFERQGKQDGAFFSPQQNRNFLRGKKELPIGILSATFREDENHHLYWSDVKTLWHEYGHALHHMLVESPYAGHTGMAVEDDAIELPSTMMETLLLDYPIISAIAVDPETGLPMSPDIYDALVAYNKRNSIEELYRTSKLSYFDLLMHHRNMKPRDAWKATHELFNIYPEFPIDYNTMTRIDHVFGGGYSSLYYSYLWADIMVCDIFQKIKDDPSFFNKYNTSILQRGAEAPMNELYHHLMERPISLDGLCAYYTLKVDVPDADAHMSF